MIELLGFFILVVIIGGPIAIIAYFARKNYGKADRRRIKAAMRMGLYHQRLIDDVTQELAEEQRQLDAKRLAKARKKQPYEPYTFGQIEE